MKSTWRPLHGLFAVLLLGLILFFQNCGLQTNTESLKASSAPQKNLSLPEPGASGNGEGYGGKLNGVYASVDALNECGQATSTHVPVRDQFEIRSGKVYQTVKGCAPLDKPATVQILPQTVSESGHLFVEKDRIFERANWVQSGFAPRDQYVDVFCQGLETHSTTQRSLEVSIFKTKQSLHHDFPWMPDLPTNPFLFRKAVLNVKDQDLQTAEVLSVQTYNYEIQETMKTDPLSGNVLHSFQLQNDFQRQSDLSFELSFVDIAGYGATSPIEMNYGFSSGSSHRVNQPICWSNR